MKHTLKSLLITTVLTLPTVFGAADHFPESTDQPTTNPQPLSIVELSDRTFALRNHPATVERLYLESLDHPDTLWSHVTFIAAALEKLGYLDSAIQAYKRSMQHPNTQMFNQIAKTKIETIKTSTSSRAPSYLNGLSVDCFKVIAGDKVSKFFLGFLPLGDLNKLALTSSKLNKFIQPLLTTANTWRHSDAVPRLLLNSAHPEDDVMLQLFGIATPTTTESFYGMILCVATDLRFPRPDATQIDAIATALHRDTGLSIPDGLVRLLMRLLMGTETLLDIRIAADELAYLEYTDRAVKLYELSVQHKDATPNYIRIAANALEAFGYTDRAVKFYERSAQHPNASPYDIQMAANYFNDHEDHEKAAKFYERSAQHPNADPTDIQMAANYFNDHEDHEKVAKLYERSAQHKDATLIEINMAAKYFNDHEDHEKAAKFYELSAQHPNADQDYIRFAARSMSKLGANYHERAAALYEKSAQHPNADPTDIQMIAGFLQALGPDYYERATALLQKRGLSE